MASGDTTLKAGSLLDDNQWHDVEIQRNGREVYFTVDRLTVTNITNGEFYQLDIDRQVSWTKKTLSHGDKKFATVSWANYLREQKITGEDKTCPKSLPNFNPNPK